MRVFFYFILTFLYYQGAWAHAPVILTTHDLEPYGYYNKDGDFIGSGVDVVRCAFKDIERPLEIRVVPWMRAQRLVLDHVADGFFAASRNDTRDSYATMSAIIAEQKWVWYYLKTNKVNPSSEGFKANARVSSFLGANMHKWLEDNGYHIYGAAPPANTDLLLRMLLNDRIDAALANDQVMGELIRTYDVSERLSSEVLKNKPLGVYFSSFFLRRNPGFLDAFNQAVKKCRAN